MSEYDGDIPTKAPITLIGIMAPSIWRKLLPSQNDDYKKEKKRKKLTQPNPALGLFLRLAWFWMTFYYLWAEQEAKPRYGFPLLLFIP